MSALACDLQPSKSGLQWCDEVVGAGNMPPRGSMIRAHYKGTLESGVTFDSSYERGRPLSFKVGTGMVIKGPACC